MAAELGVDGEIEHVELVLVQLVDHEADDPLAVLGDHADAVALAQHAEELLLAPGILEARVLDGQDLGHVAADHPADMDADLRLGGRDRAHRASFHGTNGDRTATPRARPPDQPRTAARMTDVKSTPRDGRGLAGRRDARSEANSSEAPPTCQGRFPPRPLPADAPAPAFCSIGHAPERS